MSLSSKIFFTLLISYSVYCAITVMLDNKRKPTGKNGFDFRYVDENYLLSLHPRSFEKFCSLLFFKLGYKIELTDYERDGGKDIILTDENEEKIFVECKRWTQASEKAGYMIGREICQKLVGAMVQNNVKKGMIITTATIHKNAIEFKKDLIKNNSDIELELIDMDGILDLVEEVIKLEEEKLKNEAIKQS